LGKPRNPRAAVSAFPTADEAKALQASLLDGERALEAWRSLSSSSSPEQVGIGWIAPLLMSNLRRLAPDDPWVRGNPHFLTLCDLKTRAMTDFAQSILATLHDAGIRTMALKGLALGASVYASPGLRTVSDLDILVPGPDIFRAMEALKSMGLKPGDGAPSRLSDLRGNHAQVFLPARRHQPTVDLHWHVLASARRDDDDLPFWSDSVPLRLGKTETRALCREHQLAHALIHGVRWTRMPHVRWVADVAMILRQPGPLDTEKFTGAVRRLDAVIPAQEGLRYVSQLIGEGDEIYESVRRMKRSLLADRAFRARAIAYEDRTFTDRIAMRIEDARWFLRARGALGN
jgi:hypothetical protein